MISQTGPHPDRWGLLLFNQINYLNMAKRRGKTLSQQCWHYYCDNFMDEVMMERYNRGDKKGMVEVYKELNKKARKIVVQKILDSRHLNEWSVISDIIMRLMFD